MKLRSHIDRCDSAFIEGWIFDEENLNQRFRLQFISGGQPLGECDADRFREDLAAVNLAGGTIAFSFKLPDVLPRNFLKDLRIRIVGTDAYLLPIPPETDEEPPMRSRFGGLWIDRADWVDRLAFKHRQGQIDDETALQIFRFVRDGFLVIPAAVPIRLVTQLNDEIDRVWARPPQGLLIETFEPDDKMKYIPPEIRYRAGRTKLLDLFTVSEAARRATATAAPMRFLSAIFADKPKAFQQLTFWRGSQQPMHKDSAYVKIDTNPMALAASLLALENIVAGAGEPEYYAGSHHAPEFLFGGTSKWAETFRPDHERFLASLHQDAETFGHKRAPFLGRAGDVLIWHADLAHGDAPVTRPNATRRSLLTHFTPAAEEPFYRRNAQHQEMKTEECVFVSQFMDVR